MNAPNPVTRVALRWALVVLALVLLFAAAIIVCNRTICSPAAQVKHLHQLLEEGKGAEALGLLEAKVPQGDAVALDGEVLSRTQSGITEFEADTAQQDQDVPGRVTVTAHYKAHGVPSESTYALHHDGKSWMFFDTWKFEEVTLPTVQIKANTVNEIEVNDQKIPLQKGRTELPVFFPAVLDAGFETKNFKADTRGKLITSPAQKPVEIALRTEPTSHFTQNISKQLKKYLDGCATQKVLMPTNCPFAYHTTARVDAKTIKWQITDYPKPKVSYYDGAWVLGPLTVKTELQLTEQDLRTGELKPKVVKDAFGFNANLDTSTTEVNVRPVASVEHPAH